MSIFEETFTRKRLKTYQQLALDLGGDYIQKRFDPNQVIFEHQNWKVMLHRIEKPGYQFSYNTQILAAVVSDQKLELYFSKKNLLEKIPLLDKQNIKLNDKYIDENFQLTSSLPQQKVLSVFDQQIRKIISNLPGVKIYLLDKVNLFDRKIPGQYVLEITITGSEQRYQELSNLVQLAFGILTNLHQQEIITNHEAQNIF